MSPSPNSNDVTGNGGGSAQGPSTTTPATTPSSQQQSRAGNNGNRTGNRSTRGGSNVPNRGSTNVQSTDGTTFEGGCPEINGVVGLRTEKISKKVSFSVFTDNIADYIITTFKHPADIELSVRLLTDPFEGFAESYKPAPLTVEDPSFDERYLQQERIKSYVVRENTLRDNVIKTYGLIWRQCTSALQAVIKGIDMYTVKSRSYDMIWLLSQIKSITSGVDVKMNPYVVMYESMAALFNMRQQANESNDRYTQRFKANVQTVELAKGGHMFISHELLDCPNDEDPTVEEMVREEEKFKAIIMMKRSDESRYKNLMSDLKNGDHLGRDEYPKSVAAAYDLMNRSSG